MNGRRFDRAQRRVLALGSVALLMAACRPAVLPDSATPVGVLDAYLRAVVAGDCGIARRLATGSFSSSGADLCGTTNLADYAIDAPPARITDDEAEFHATLSTMASGATKSGHLRWVYELRRQSSGAWRLAGGGPEP